MCYLLFGKKIAKKNDKSIITGIMESKSKQNPDGFCYLNNEYNLLRTLERDEFGALFDNMLSRSNWFISHARQATDGAITIANVHLFEKDGFYFAHNGIISEYSSYTRATAKSDSLLYFESLINSIKCFDKMHIVKRIKKSKFFNGGRAMLLAPDGKLYIYGDFHLYLIAGWFLISSARLDLSTGIDTRIFGDLALESQAIYNGASDGIYCFNPDAKAPEFEYLGELPEDNYNIYNNYSGYTSKYSHYTQRQIGYKY